MCIRDRRDTEEKYLQQVNRVIDYINSHLNEPLRVETLAREVCLSEYHFHRIMRAYLHEPLATYIARQRVERAVMYLPVSYTHLDVYKRQGFSSLLNKTCFSSTTLPMVSSHP